MSMALPVPNLDDRRFQDLVDDAKRLVQQRCPEWTDHNVSDPGVTLIETFAWMTDQVLYRLNRVPERNYIKFLELIGVRLFPPTAARAAITFWLAGPQPGTIHIRPGTQAATVRTEADEAIVFTTIGDVPIVPCTLSRLASSLAGQKEVSDHTDALEARTSFFCFGKVPKPDDGLLVGLSESIPSCAVTLRFRCDIEGVGVDPENPRRVWEAWDGYAWSSCEVDRDGTGGLNRDGDVVLHIPKSHTVSVINQQRAGWLRARVLKPEPDQPTYSASPIIKGLTAFTIGGTAEAVNAELVENELLGASEGVPGQRFALKHRPVVPGGAANVLEVGGVDGEDIEGAKVRGPIVLRTRDRAVTMEDYEHLAREAAPEVARVRCVTAGDGADAGGVRILVVPAAGSTDGRLRFEQLVPAEETLQRIAHRLEDSRVIGTRVLVEPPVYRGVTVVAKLRPRASANPSRLQAEALDALFHYFHPVTGGPDRNGWPFGRPAHFQEDGFTQRFMSAFDAALAPIFATMDNLPTYFDPWLTPPDFLEWLGSWFGLALDDSWSVERRRAVLAAAFEFYRMRGTVKGLKAQIETLTGGTVEIIDTGGIATSTTAGEALPGSPNFALMVRVAVDDPAAINATRLDALVAAAKPAHVTHKVQLVKRSKVPDAVEVTSA